MFTYGTTAEYSVGLVILILASKDSVDGVVSNIRKDPISGEKPLRLPPDIAGSQIISIVDDLYIASILCIEKRFTNA